MKIRNYLGTFVYYYNILNYVINDMLSQWDLAIDAKITFGYGLAGLKSYELLVPAYITEDGDIFGQKDMVQGLRYNNCKIIVVQRINLYDQINELFRDFEDEEPMNEIISKYSIIKDEIRILGLMIVIIHLSSIAHFCNMYNKKYIKNEDEN